MREPGGVARAALAHVRARAEESPLDRSLRVTVHFHPDRLVGGRVVLERLAEDGRYRTQFETGTSNGGLSAYPGGFRWEWESRLFGAAYDGAAPVERPVYGSLNHRRRAEGGSIRFGSAHLRLSEATLDRTTFCYPESIFEPTALGTVETASALVALADADRRDRLDDYVEAHVHGAVLLARDVEAVVLDPSFRDTPVERVAQRLPVPVEWHQGFRLGFDELALHADYRGADVVEAGRRLALGGRLDAALVGRAARRGAEDGQTLKRLWHCVARFGLPAEADDG